MLLTYEFDKFFADAVKALSPYLDDIVCLGGCANALYRHHAHATNAPLNYVGTMDFDVGVPQLLEHANRPPVSQIMKDIGLKEITCGDAHEAVIKYAPSDNSPIDLEFLCEKSGLSTTDQKRAAYAVQDGLYAQPLRYLQMSLNNTWEVSLGDISGMESVSDISLSVPNPAAYVVSKILIRNEQRPPSSMRKDCFYIYEISVIFRNALDHIKEEYDRLTPCLPKWKMRFAKDVRAIFASETADGPVSAVQVYRDLGSPKEDVDVSEEMVMRSVNRLLDAMLG